MFFRSGSCEEVGWEYEGIEEQGIRTTLASLVTASEIVEPQKLPSVLPSSLLSVYKISTVTLQGMQKSVHAGQKK